jgi:hypothetical protein
MHSIKAFGEDVFVLLSEPSPHSIHIHHHFGGVVSRRIPAKPVLKSEQSVSARTLKYEEVYLRDHRVRKDLSEALHLCRGLGRIDEASAFDDSLESRHRNSST